MQHYDQNIPSDYFMLVDDDDYNPPASTPFSATNIIEPSMHNPMHQDIALSQASLLLPGTAVYDALQYSLASMDAQDFNALYQNSYPSALQLSAIEPHANMAFDALQPFSWFFPMEQHLPLSLEPQYQSPVAVDFEHRRIADLLFSPTPSSQPVPETAQDHVYEELVDWDTSTPGPSCSSQATTEKGTEQIDWESVTPSPSYSPQAIAEQGTEQVDWESVTPSPSCSSQATTEKGTEQVDWESPTPSPSYSPLAITEQGTEQEDIHANGQSNRKRTRTPLQLRDKLRIIAFWDENQPISFLDLGHHFGLARTTVYGIIKKRHICESLARSQPRADMTFKTSRMAPSHFRIHEELLMAWFTDLRSRCIPVSGKMLTTQIFEVHRMLSRLLLKPPRPILFTSGWLTCFKRRRSICLETMRDDITANEENMPELKLLKFYLQNYNSDDIYFCDTTGMFLDMMPSTTNRDGNQHTIHSNQDNPYGMEVDHQSKFTSETRVLDLTRPIFENWLTELDNSLQRRTLLIMDEAMWAILKTRGRPTPFFLKHIKTDVVTGRVGALLPMSKRIAKEFKLQYLGLSIARWRQVMAEEISAPTQTLALETSLGFVTQAWQRVQGSTIQDSYNEVLALFGLRNSKPTKRLARSWSAMSSPSPSSSSPSSSRASASPPPQSVDSTESTLRAALKEAIPNIRESALSYYLNQDKEIGPTGFLRSKILAIQAHEEFKALFREVDFGRVAFGSKEPSSRQENLFQHFSQKLLTYE
ncbi:Tigger transposable element-derived protein 6 [Dissophora globulifera]|uniref:Tigger transposable element-derived protein 6 n=1 Tax=Dissophora globulifera TaxID=979702 RepID=A0A9P6RQR0_9FUNG|nr:Tigger transposable element-derived protein 6 [Dissophora globulifera]